MLCFCIRSVRRVKELIEMKDLREANRSLRGRMCILKGKNKSDRTIHPSAALELLLASDLGHCVVLHLLDGTEEGAYGPEKG